MNMGTFEAMNQKEMMEVNGGKRWSKADTKKTIVYSIGSCDAAYGLMAATGPVGIAVAGVFAAGTILGMYYDCKGY